MGRFHKSGMIYCQTLLSSLEEVISESCQQQLYILSACCLNKPVYLGCLSFPRFEKGLNEFLFLGMLQQSSRTKHNAVDSAIFVASQLHRFNSMTSRFSYPVLSSIYGLHNMLHVVMCTMCTVLCISLSILIGLQRATLAVISHHLPKMLLLAQSEILILQ